MDDTMDFTRSDQAQRQPSVSSAGQNLHQHQVGQWLHSPVLPSIHQNQNTPSFSSSSSHQPVVIHPLQHHNIYQNQYSHSHQLPAGFNGPFSNPPLCYAQPAVVQQTPLPPSTVQFSLGQKQSEQMREASERYFEGMQQLLQLQYQHTMELINQQFHWFSMYWSTRQQAHNQQQSSPIITQLQGTSYQAPYPNVVATTAINERHQQKSSMDQLIVPAPATVTTTQCDEQQQQQKQQSKTPIPVTAAPDGDGSEENELEHTRKSEYTAEVFNSYNVGSRREAIIIFELINTKSVIHEFDVSAVQYITSYHQVNPKFVQHFLDRNGHQMDLTSGSAAVFSDLFVWIVNHGGTRIKLRWSNSSSRQHDHRPRYQHCPPSPLFPRPKTAAMETPSTIQRGRC